MTEYTKCLNDAWDYLISQYERGDFKPLKEADIQAFLYHSLITKGLQPSKIHVEWSGGKKRRCDIVLGNKKLFVEIKWSSLRNRSKPSKRWKNDLTKLKNWGGNRKPVLVLFITEKNGRSVSDETCDRKYPNLRGTLRSLREKGNYARVLTYPRI